MNLNGMIYIFVQPNGDSVLAFLLASQEKFQPMNTFYYPHEMNITELKNVLTFYV